MKATQFATTAFGASIEENRGQFLESLRRDGQGVLCRIQPKFQSNGKEGQSYPIGEIAPLILRDISKLNSESDHDLIEAWYYTYAATVLIDDLADGDLEMTSTALLDTVALVHKATVKLVVACKSDQTKARVLSLLDDALTGQYRDVQSFGTLSKSRRSSDSDKNRMLTALAEIYAERSSSADRSVLIIDKLIPIFQQLDDVSDLFEDYQCGNFTYLIQQVLVDENVYLFPRSQLHLIEEILKQGRFSQVCQSLASELTEVLERVSAESQTHEFLTAIRSDLGTAGDDMRELERCYRDRSITLDAAAIRFRQNLRIVAQSS